MPEQVLTNLEPEGGAPDPNLLPGGNGVDDGAAAAPSPEQIAKAREQGWRPREEYDGEPTKFVEAAEYLERAEQILPIVRARDRESRERIAQLEADLANVKKDSAQAVEFARVNAKREFDATLTDLRTRRAEAVTNSDGEAFAKIDKEITDLLADAPAAPKTPNVPADPKYPPALVEASDAFIDRNPWFKTDERKNRLAFVVSQELVRKRPELKNNPAVFEEIEKKLKADYPEIFGNQRRAAAEPMVEGEGRPAGARPNGKHTIRDLSKEAQEAARRQVKNGMCKTEQEYVDNWFAAYGEA